MSDLGNVVQARTIDTIRAAALEARQRLRIETSGRIILVEDFVERLMFDNVSRAYKVDVDWRTDEDEQLSGALAMYRSRESELLVRDEVFRKARSGDPDAHFTLFHEIGHIHMHSERELFRLAPDRKPTKFHDPEWQADLFAIEFAIDRDELVERFGRHHLRSAAAYYKIPYSRLQAHFLQYIQRGAINQKANSVESYLDAVQGDFDF